MASISYQKKEVFQIRLEIGDSLGGAIGKAQALAEMEFEDFDCFTITAFEGLAGGGVEITLAYLAQDQEV